MNDQDEEEDPCSGCDYEDDICFENCSMCEHFEEDSPCEGCEYEDDICFENCDGCPNYEDDDPCECCSYNDIDCRTRGFSCSAFDVRFPGGDYSPNQEVDCPAGDSAPEIPIEEYDPNAEDTRSMLERVSDKLFEAVGRKFRIIVYDSQAVNAGTNGSEVFVSSAAVQELDEDELAWLISHEIAHIGGGHVRETRGNLKSVAREAVNSFMESGGVVSGLIQGLIVGTAGYAGVCNTRRQHELEADLEAQAILEKAGYDPNAAVDFLKKHRGSGGRTFDSHPTDSERIRNLKRNGR